MVLLYILYFHFSFSNANECSAIKLNGYSKGQIPFSIVNKTIGLDIEKEYKFESATIYITGKGFNEPVVFRLFYEKFDKNLIQIFKKIKPEQNIVIDEIKIKEKPGRYINCNRIGFNVVM